MIRGSTLRICLTPWHCSFDIFSSLMKIPIDSIRCLSIINRTEVLYVRAMQEVFVAHGFTKTHTRQLWDFVRGFWLAAVEKPGLARIPVATSRVTNETVWDWLLSVYRQQGGGGTTRRGTNQQCLPSSCVKFRVPFNLGYITVLCASGIGCYPAHSTTLGGSPATIENPVPGGIYSTHTTGLRTRGKSGKRTSSGPAFKTSTHVHGCRVPISSGCMPHAPRTIDFASFATRGVAQRCAAYPSPTRCHGE